MNWGSQGSLFKPRYPPCLPLPRLRLQDKAGSQGGEQESPELGLVTWVLGSATSKSGGLRIVSAPQGPPGPFVRQVGSFWRRRVDFISK